MRDLAISSHATSRRAGVPAVIVGVLAAAAAGWLVLSARMAGMDSGPGGDPGALGWFAGTWAVMTVAMMFPASAPAVLRVVRGRRAHAPETAVLFLVGYAAVWMLAGLAGYSLIQAGRDLHVGVLAWSSAGRYLAGASVVAAGLYQLTHAKRRWLARCSTPERHLPSHRAAGTLRAGAEHGGCCVACCGTLMAALYALGMMSITWTAVITVLIVGERLVPRPAFALRTVAAVLVVLGVALALSPSVIPALTIPTKPRPMTMGMRGPVGDRPSVPGL